ncbi:MAG: S-layer homology domain-containing protein [Candidatus Aquicultor sp.]
MSFRNNSKPNKATIKPAFFVLLLVISLSAIFMLTAYAENATPLVKPSGLEAKADTSTVTLTWAANTEADLGGYNIYRNTTDTTVGANLASVDASATSYADTSVAVGTTYYYWLSAIDTATPANESEKAGPVSASLSSTETGGDQTDTDTPSTFKDITNAHWARSYIEELLASGIVNGYADGSFRPQSDVTRAEFAKMVCEIMVKRANWVLSTETSSSLTDVQDHWAAAYIATVNKYGAMVGYNTADGTVFRPDRNITRAEIAKIISSVLKLERGKSNLKDVSTHWAKDDINACVKAGIVSGYKNGNFEPSSFATRAEVCKMLVKMMKLLDTQNNKGKSTK